MNRELKEKLSFINGDNQDATEKMLQILSLPDDIFDAAYPDIKESIPSIYQNQGIQKEILTVLMENPDFDIDEEITAIEEMIGEIWKEDSLSDNKKEMLELIIRDSTEMAFDFAKNPRERIPVKIQLIHENAKVPVYAHNSDAGADIYLPEDVTIPPHKTVIVKTGFKIAVPLGYEVQVRPRSGLSAKTPLRVANAPGTIDANYRGEVGVIIENTGNLTQNLKAGDKIAQLLIAPTPMIKWEQVDELNETDRGSGGFGSTDKKS